MNTDLYVTHDGLMDNSVLRLKQKQEADPKQLWRIYCQKAIEEVKEGK